MRSLKSLLTGIITLAALGNSLEARASEEDRKFTVSLNYGYFLPRGEEFSNFYGPAGALEGKVIWHGLAPEIGISFGANYYNKQGSSTTEMQRTLFGGRRLIYLDRAELTRIGIPVGLRLIPSPSVYFEGGVEVVNVNEATEFFLGDYSRELTELEERNSFGNGVYGEAGFRLKIGEGKEKNSYLLFRVRGDSVKINKGNKPEVGGVTASLGLEFDIN